MHCAYVRMLDGSVGILTYARSPRRRCWVDGCRSWHDVLCDHPTGKKPGSRRTCSRPLCRAHAVHQEPDRDYCPEHVPGAARAPCTPAGLGPSQLTLAEARQLDRIEAGVDRAAALLGQLLGEAPW